MSEAHLSLEHFTMYSRASTATVPFPLAALRTAAERRRPYFLRMVTRVL